MIWRIVRAERVAAFQICREKMDPGALPAKKANQG
jgi:hypothetical protein